MKLVADGGMANAKVFYLRFVENMSVGEIAKVLNRSTTIVGVRCRKMQEAICKAADRRFGDLGCDWKFDESFYDDQP